MDTNIDIDIQLFKLYGLLNNPALNCNELRCISPQLTKMQQTAVHFTADH